MRTSFLCVSVYYYYECDVKTCMREYEFWAENKNCRRIMYVNLTRDPYMNSSIY